MIEILPMAVRWVLILALALSLAAFAASLAFAHLDVMLVQRLGTSILESFRVDGACTCNMVVRVALIAFTRPALAAALALLPLQILQVK